VGIHFFDLLLWLFGPVTACEVHLHEPRRMSGVLELQRATVTWFLSTDVRDLPFGAQPGARMTFRSMTIDGDAVNFTDGVAELHTRVYEDVLAGRGFTIEDARPSIELTARIRTHPVTPPSHLVHPLLAAPSPSGIA
jgi:UDP-N-acetyl-2-amino-2-deoxyglucuronate dehydrogenase